MKKMSITFVCFHSMIFLISCAKAHNEASVFNKNTEDEIRNELPIGTDISFATGQAALLLSHLNGRVQHFSFHVIKDVNGNVTGTWELKSPGQNLRTHRTLNCLTFINNHTAYMTGVVTQKVGDVFHGEYEVGMPVWFKVRDNGEGNNSSADEFTD